jgi:ATP-dependent RNA helicase DDX27
LAGEAERKIVREIVRRARDPVKARLVPPEIVAKYRAKLADLEEDVKRVTEEEQAEREIARLENRANRLQNTMESGGGPERDRTWFQTKKERLDEQKRLKKEGASATLTKKKKKKAAAAAPPADPREVVARQQLDRDAAFVVRQAKRSRKQKRIRTFNDGDEGRRQRGEVGGKGGTKKRKASSFEADFGSTKKKAKFTPGNKKNASFRNKKF